jgi:hypothetical protein
MLRVCDVAAALSNRFPHFVQERRSMSDGLSGALQCGQKLWLAFSA